ncbi:RPA-interacting protein B-like [Oscarella lobularis]|uniref:RPA-interacting protein B-like n=1 Tax=Oscarella lobularis TaxID=121494 RepID=UPI0033132E35
MSQNRDLTSDDNVIQLIREEALQLKEEIMEEEGIGHSFTDWPCDDIDRLICSDVALQAEIQEAAVLLLEEELTRSSVEEEEAAARLNVVEKDLVVCPLCRTNYLYQVGSVIKCSCGVAIDTEQDCIGLSYVRTQLEDLHSEHSSQCLLQLEFSLQTLPNMSRIHLLVKCNNCNFVGIVV